MTISIQEMLGVLKKYDELYDRACKLAKLIVPAPCYIEDVEFNTTTRQAEVKFADIRLSNRVGTLTCPVPFGFLETGSGNEGAYKEWVESCNEIDGALAPVLLAANIPWVD